jgi:hypothetical protein
VEAKERDGRTSRGIRSREQQENMLRSRVNQKKKKKEKNKKMALQLEEGKETNEEEGKSQLKDQRT